MPQQFNNPAIQTCTADNCCVKIIDSLELSSQFNAVVCVHVWIGLDC